MRYIVCVRVWNEEGNLTGFTVPCQTMAAAQKIQAFYGARNAQIVYDGPEPDLKSTDGL